MILADQLAKDWPQTEVSGYWVLSRPYPGPWIWRVRDAWAVFRGRAEAVGFVENETDLVRLLESQ